MLSEYGESLLVRSPNNGTVFLRETIAQYLARSRRMNVTADQIIIGSGSEYLYNLIVQMLGRERIFALEDPSYEKIRLVYEASGVCCRMLPMDRKGVRLSALKKTDATVLHVTPFNSYPSGITATASRRADYIRWASAEDRFIIEDDFDSEFSMSTKAEDTLFSLEPEKSVIYMNTFTRTISPAVRVGYMVLPAQLSASSHSICLLSSFEAATSNGTSTACGEGAGRARSLWGNEPSGFPDPDTRKRGLLFAD